MIYEIIVPASTANLGPGYDLLGLALNRYLKVRARASESWRVATRGEGETELPTGERNLIIRTILDVSSEMGIEPNPLELDVTNEIPVERGMGGSSTAIVAGVLLAHLFGKHEEIDKNRILQIAAEFEGHLDNLAPAVLGGLRKCRRTDGVWIADSLPIHQELRVAMAIPEIRSNTIEMRGVLPSSYSVEDEALTTRALETLIHGIATGDAPALAASEWDVKHQPHRFPLLPESHRIYQAFQKEPFIAGTFLSGSGSSVAGWFFERDMHRIPDLARKIGNQVQTLEPDRVGMRWHTFEPNQF